jgi:hypothetical protein
MMAQTAPAPLTSPSRFRSFAREEWNLGVVRQTVTDIVARGIVKPVHWVEPDPWRVLADPFCYERQDGRIMVLAEKLDHWEGRGEIFSALLPLDGALRTSDFKLFATSRAHLSYPFRIQDKGVNYLTMESFETGHLHLWREDRDGFTYIKPVLDRPVIDPTLHFQDGLWWLFCTFFDDLPNEKLHLFFSESLEGLWRAHPQNPIRWDISAARPAGALFQTPQGLIRPAQNCRDTYGGALTLKQVVELTTTAFDEITVRDLLPIDPYPNGIHTIAGAGQFTLIDGKRWHCEVPANITRKVVAKGFKMLRQSGAQHSGVDFVYSYSYYKHSS